MLSNNLSHMMVNLLCSVLLDKIPSKEREEEFHRRYPDFSPFFRTVVNDDYSLFREGLLFLIDVSNRLESQL